MSDPVAELSDEAGPPRAAAPGTGTPEPGGPASEPSPPGAEGDEGAEGEGPEPEAVGPGPAEAGPPAVTYPSFRVVSLVSVQVDLPTEHPSVVLRETDLPRRQLTFSVRLQDGIVLSHVLRRIATPRPLTHELLASVMQSFEIDVVATRLVGRTGPVYFAELDLRSRQGRAVLSCRPSDGLAAALSQPVAAPILVDERLLEGPGDVAPG